MRALLVLFSSASGYLVVLEIVGQKLAYIGVISGLIIAVIALLFEEKVKKTPLRIIAGGAIGLISGLVVANLLTFPLSASLIDSRHIEFAAYLLSNSIIGYIGLSLGMRKGDEFQGVPLSRFLKDPADNRLERRAPEASMILMDTSVIIDGRISEVVDSGFIEGPIIVPRFVLTELQHIADASDGIKRQRGKKGLDVLKQIQQNGKAGARVLDRDFPDIKEVDSKLVALAKELNAKILTNDSNLNKVAELHGVSVLNMHRLASALKPQVMPGEVMCIHVLKEGKEQGQGVGYLEDGTMVVIDNAREHLGKAIDVSITSVLQTTGGRMIFSKVKDDLKRVVFQ